MPERLQSGLVQQALLESYLDTHYDVRMPGGVRVTVRCGHSLPVALAEIIGQASSGFLVTACNPRSVRLSSAENRQRMRSLLLHAKATACLCLPGVGHIPGQPWRESLLFVSAIDVESIDEIARRFDQNAVVRLRAGRTARLRIYRSGWRREIPESVDIEWAPNQSPT